MNLVRSGNLPFQHYIDHRHQHGLAVSGCPRKTVRKDFVSDTRHDEWRGTEANIAVQPSPNIFARQSNSLQVAMKKRIKAYHHSWIRRIHPSNHYGHRIANFSVSIHGSANFRKWIPPPAHFHVMNSSCYTLVVGTWTEKNRTLNINDKMATILRWMTRSRSHKINFPNVNTGNWATIRKILRSGSHQQQFK